MEWHLRLCERTRSTVGVVVDAQARRKAGAGMAGKAELGRAAAGGGPVKLCLGCLLVSEPRKSGCFAIYRCCYFVTFSCDIR
jgi:hypothetical protein